MDVQIAASSANQTAEDLARRVNDELSRLPDKVLGSIDKMTYGVDPMMYDINATADAEMADLGVTPEFTPEFSANISQQFDERIKANIKNYTPEQVNQLRDLVQKGLIQGIGREDIRQLLMSQFGATEAKARFGS